MDLWVEQANQEHLQMETALDEDPDLIHGRLLRVLDYIEQETDIYSDLECKIVVFTGYNATLQEFLRIANKRLDKQGLLAVAFGDHMSRDELEDSVFAFQNEDYCRMIICDEKGGEGRNFARW